MQALESAMSEGIAHLDAGRFGVAEQMLRRVAAQHPRYPAVFAVLAMAASQAGHDEAACRYARRAAALDPLRPQPHLLLANLLAGQGKLAEAVPAYEAALQRDPGAANTWFLLAGVHAELGDVAAAITCYRGALDRQPDLVTAAFDLGNLLIGAAQPDAAISCFRSGLLAQPDHVGCANNLATLLRDAGRLPEAADCLIDALRRTPHEAGLYQTFGTVLAAAGRHADAAEAFRTVLRLRPDHVDALHNLGCELKEIEQLEDAVQCLRTVLRQAPDNPDVHSNLGATLHRQGFLDEAETCLRRALALAPEHLEARCNLAAILLLTGRWREGWPLMEARWQRRDMPPLPAVPAWRGGEIGGRRLLLSAEQGLGDTLQFCRYVPLLAARVRVVLQVQAPLQRLLAQSFPGVEVVAAEEPAPAADLHCPLMSLPLAHGTTPDDVPAQPYLVAEPAAAARWRERLSALPGLRVGLVWTGSPVVAQTNRVRALPPRLLGCLADLAGVSFVSLQKGVSDAERRELAAVLPVQDWTAELQDFADTAALVAGLDLVIAVDTSVAHLAGALGRPVWLLNRFVPCWRWLLEREDSPWYPGLRQFRQTAWGDWEGVLHRVHRALAAAIAAHSPGTPPDRFG